MDSVQGAGSDHLPLPRLTKPVTLLVEGEEKRLDLRLRQQLYKVDRLILHHLGYGSGRTADRRDSHGVRVLVERPQRTGKTKSSFAQVSAMSWEVNA